MKQIVPIVLTALMMTSLFAGIDFVDELKDTNEMETGARADYELNLHDVLEPRETFVDQPVTPGMELTLVTPSISGRSSSMMVTTHTTNSTFV